MKVEEASDEEYNKFLKELSEVETKTPIALLLIEKPFCDKYDGINIQNYKYFDSVYALCITDFKL